MQNDLSDAEWRLIQLIRTVGFGQLTIEVSGGQPKSWSALVANRLDKPDWPGQIQLLQQLTQSSQ